MKQYTRRNLPSILCRVFFSATVLYSVLTVPSLQPLVFADFVITTGVGDIILGAGGGTATAQAGVVRNGWITANNSGWVIDNDGTLSTTGDRAIRFTGVTGEVRNSGVISAGHDCGWLMMPETISAVIQQSTFQWLLHIHGIDDGPLLDHWFAMIS